MITSTGYSKDPSLQPEGIVITFGREMMKEQGGYKLFLRNFQEVMDENDEGRYWMAKCSNLPKIEVDVVYIIALNRLYGRAYCGGYRLAGNEIGHTADGKEKLIDWNHIILSGPFERCPIRRNLKGFQGIRYSTKLW